MVIDIPGISFDSFIIVSHNPCEREMFLRGKPHIYVMLDVVRNANKHHDYMLRYNPRSKTDKIHTTRSHSNNKNIMAIIKLDLKQRGFGTSHPDWFLAEDVESMIRYIVEVYENPEEALHGQFNNIKLPVWNFM